MSDAANLAKAERELIAARATLAEHVEENLSLHRRVNELEAKMAEATTWLVTVKAEQPASIIAERARLALAALRG
jgi:hypothetical protein